MHLPFNIAMSRIQYRHFIQQDQNTKWKNESNEWKLGDDAIYQAQNFFILTHIRENCINVSAKTKKIKKILKGKKLIYSMHSKKYKKKILRCVALLSNKQNSLNFFLYCDLFIIIFYLWI